VTRTGGAVSGVPLIDPYRTPCTDPLKTGRAKLARVSGGWAGALLTALVLPYAATMAVPESTPEVGGKDYALGRSSAETDRLIAQHHLYGPFTRQFLVGAGITSGMKVLDLGSGAGDVSLLLAELVGPQGQVVGVDNDPEILATARDRVRAAGWTTVSFAAGTVGDLDLDRDFDAVVGRWLLMYLPDPAALLRQARTLLRAGGVMAFQEGDIRSSARTFPSAPLHEQLARLVTPAPGAPGPDVDMGPKLFQTFIAAGLPAPQLRHDTPIGGGPDWPGFGYLTATVRNLLPFLIKVAAITPEQLGMDSLEDRLRAEVVSQDGIQLLPPLIGAWTRV
jgi:SAM-dependent methyltransferase